MRKQACDHERASEVGKGGEKGRIERRVREGGKGTNGGRAKVKEVTGSSNHGIDCK